VKKRVWVYPDGVKNSRGVLRLGFTDAKEKVWPPDMKPIEVSYKNAGGVEGVCSAEKMDADLPDGTPMWSSLNADEERRSDEDLIASIPCDHIAMGSLVGCADGYVSDSHWCPSCSARAAVVRRGGGGHPAPSVCPHTNATADVLEGDGRGHQVVWCRDCGAYARKFEQHDSRVQGWTTEWRLPRQATTPLEVCPRCQGTRVLPGGVNCSCGTGFVERPGAWAAFPKDVCDRLVEVTPVGQAELWQGGSDNVSLAGEEGGEPGEGEAGLTGGVGPGLVIRPLCPECSSTEVMLAHVHTAQADVPALVILCDACRLASITQVPRAQLDAVIRRVRATRSGDWRYRVR
jgi:hypothetical protein